MTDDETLGFELRLQRAALALILVASALTGCGGATPGEALRPAEGSAKDVLDREPAGVCHVVSNFGEPLVVDWEAHQRADVEEAMHDGVAVVAYDCKSLRLLKGCSVDGTYGFVGVSKKEEVVQLENKDELYANLPAFGAHMVKDFGAEMDRGSTLDVAMILVGKKRTTVQHATRAELRGGAACEGATHFLRGAFVGAFALGLGTKGKASVAASVFGGADSESTKLSKYRDGQPDTCKQVEPGADSAPSTCNALVRLELVALDAPAKGDDTQGNAACPAGMVYSGGKCTRASSGKAHTCKWLDSNDCGQQCSQGDAASCEMLGRMHMNGEGVPKDEGRALTLLRQACDGHSGAGCNNLGVLYDGGRGAPRDQARAIGLFKQGCDLGESVGCQNLGLKVENGWGIPKDAIRGIALYKQACDMGNPAACRHLAEVNRDGLLGVTKDAGRATAFFKQSCDGGNNDSCFDLANMLSWAQGLPADYGRAAPLYQKVCAAGNMPACRSLGDLVLAGRGAPRDEARASALFTRGCDGRDAFSCARLGDMAQSGQGGPKSPPRAIALYKRACDNNFALGCVSLGTMYENGEGIPKDAAQATAMFEQACAKGTAQACAHAADLYDKRPLAPKDTVMALYKKACDGGFAPACPKLVASYKSSCTLGKAASCASLGWLYDSGTAGVAKDMAHAITLYKQACDRHDGNGCFILALVYVNGNGVTKDMARAAAIYKQACDAKDVRACNNLGLMYKNADTVKQDDPHAVMLFKQACDGNEPNGCANLGNMYELGRAVPADRANAVRFYRQGCKTGSPWGCDQLKRLGEPR